MPRIRATSCTCWTDASASASWPSSAAAASRSWPRRTGFSYVRDLSVVELLRGGAVLATGIVGSLPEVVPPISLLPNDELLLVRADVPGSDAVRDESGAVVEPAFIHCTLDAAFASVRQGESLWLDDRQDRRHRHRQRRLDDPGQDHPDRPNGGRLRAGKGINFPDTQFAMSALTAKDRADLEQVVGFVDMVALSFLRGPTTSWCSRIIFTASVPGTWVSC